MYGGVSFYVRSSINFSLSTDLSIDQLENVCIEVRKPNSKPFLVRTWYRPPDSIVDKFNFFETLIGKMDAENVDLIYAFRKLSAGKHTKGHTTISYRNFKHFDADSFRNDNQFTGLGLHKNFWPSKSNVACLENDFS
ncbi:unnamed protein product [Porites lobata]|uniref:Uncharacterized protein n=1 Tax=Porites lobata TaxID=104759 RepID=A0ABN8N703_9CNID|nr:unnamed protein product [Porites lobata]